VHTFRLSCGHFRTFLLPHRAAGNRGPWATMSFREEPTRPGHLARTFWPSRYRTLNHRPGKCFKFWTVPFWELDNKVVPETEHLQLATPPPSPGDSPTLIESSDDEADEPEVAHQSSPISIQDVSVFRIFVLAKSMFLLRLRSPTADPIELD
jgi:hypothetical protein